MATTEVVENRERKLAMYIYVLPNLVTTCNLFAGFFAIIQALKGNFLWSAYAIVIAAIFDTLDDILELDFDTNRLLG